jgi:hypothetical protein
MNIWTSKAGSQQGEAVGEELCVPLVRGQKMDQGTSTALFVV